VTAGLALLFFNAMDVASLVLNETRFVSFLHLVLARCDGPSKVERDRFVYLLLPGGGRAKIGEWVFAFCLSTGSGTSAIKKDVKAVQCAGLR